METKRRYNILVTGSKGFIGWNFIKYLFRQDELEFTNLICVDSEDYAAINHFNSIDKRYRYFNGKMGMIGPALIENFSIDLIINFAAHTHVDNSINEVESFVENNIAEMSRLADAARRYWEKHSIDGLFVQISTDEVFGSVEDQGGNPFNEYSFYHPNNPYSATKTAAEMLLKSFGNTYKFPYIITNCSNNYGPGQHEEKLIPKIITHCMEGKKIPIYGDGQQRRDWIFVKDHCEGIVSAILHGEKGESYLFGTNKTITNLELTQLICGLTARILGGDDFGAELIEFVEDRKGHDKLYQIDYLKAYSRLGWYPKTGFAEGLDDTITWYVNNNMAYLPMTTVYKGINK